MGPKFDKIGRRPNGDLLVEGPFDTHGDVIDDVFVRFLIIGEGLTGGPVFGTATVPASALTKSGPITSGKFSADVTGSGLAVGAKVRAIGLSVAVKGADDHDPPAFETFTWCVTMKVTSAPAAVPNDPTA